MIRSHLDQHPELKKDFDLLTSIKSVGYQLGLNMGSPQNSEKIVR